MSKRLAFAITVIVFIISIWYLLFSLPAVRDKKGIPVFSYHSLPLRFYKGKACILAKSGYTAYKGEVRRGTAQGKGILYTKDGDMLYEGEFSEGVYDGDGTLYRDNGTKEYSGKFKDGRKNGIGEQLNESGQTVYKGRYKDGSIVYEELSGVATAEVSDRYTGKKTLYSREDEICVAMPEIDALYYGRSGEDSVEGQWKTAGVYVFSGNAVLEGRECKNGKELKDALGVPEYQGTTVLQPADVVAMYQLGTKEKRKYGKKVSLETAGDLEDAKTVSEFSRDIECYIYTFRKDGFLYTFFTYSKDGGFSFYLIEPES